MTNRTRDLRVLAAAALAALSCACDRGNSATPTSPSTPAAAVTQTYTLSGTVTELASTGVDVPVEGVLVEDMSSLLSGTTDANGLFSIEGVSGGLFLSLSKSGYVPMTRAFAAGANNINIRIATIPMTYTLDGLAFEVTSAGRVPVQGVRIEAYMCDTDCHGDGATTGEDGLYRLSLSAGQNSVYVYRAGYQFDGPILPNCENCIAVLPIDRNGRFDVPLVRQ